LPCDGCWCWTGLRCGARRWFWTSLLFRTSCRCYMLRLGGALLLGGRSVLGFGCTLHGLGRRVLGFRCALHRRRCSWAVFRCGRVLLHLCVVLLDGDAALLLLPDCGGGFGDVRGTGGYASGTGQGSLFRTTVVGGVELRVVAGCRCADLCLSSDRAYVAFAGCDELGRAGTDVDAALSAVVADPVGWPHAVVDVVVNHVAAVDVGGEADVVDGAVVVEVVAMPVAAEVAGADVTEAVVNTAVEADVETPVAVVEAVAAAVEAPIGGCPESAVVGRRAPYARDPVVALVAPAPVAGGPDVVGIGSGRLVVVGQRWRSLLGVLVGALGVVLVGIVARVLGVVLFDGSRSLLAAGVGLGLLLRGVGSALAEDLGRLAAIYGSEVAVGCIGSRSGGAVGRG